MRPWLVPELIMNSWFRRRIRTFPDSELVPGSSSLRIAALSTLTLYKTRQSFGRKAPIWTGHDLIQRALIALGHLPHQGDISSWNQPLREADGIGWCWHSRNSPS
jgi:hypothetical protein